ncbi:MAG: 3-isopropylmalate dehydratase small subunit [Deltaproteobacteria bacterium]|nr:3-isopropylmalate dehydratase small subunit [Deltaproteobacteria bacterium]
MIFTGKGFRFGDNVDTDQILPSQYLVLPSIKEMSKHAMEPLLKDFSDKFKSGDILVAGHNFGCGSSREQAPAVLKLLGVQVIIAKDFARIFFRNCINIGILLIELKEADDFQDGDVISIDTVKSIIINKNKTYTFTPLSDFLKNIISQGGLVNYFSAKK